MYMPSLMRETGIRQLPDRPPGNLFLRSLFSWLNSNFKEHQNLGFYADQLHLTGKYLSSLIRSVSGKTAGQWIHEYLVMN